MAVRQYKAVCNDNLSAKFWQIVFPCWVPTLSEMDRATCFKLTNHIFPLMQTHLKFIPLFIIIFEME